MERPRHTNFKEVGRKPHVVDKKQQVVAPRVDGRQNHGILQKCENNNQCAVGRCGKCGHNKCRCKSSSSSSSCSSSTSFCEPVKCKKCRHTKCRCNKKCKSSSSSSDGCCSDGVPKVAYKVCVHGGFAQIAV